MNERKSTICRDFQLTVISASNLRVVRQHFGMKVYAKVSFNGDKKTEKKTPVDKNNGVNPAWNFPISYFYIAEGGVMQYGLTLVVKLYCKIKLGPDRYIGEAHIQVKDLFDRAAPYGYSAVLSLRVQTGATPTADSAFNFSYRFGDRIEIIEPPLWQKVLRSSAVILFRVTLILATGSDLNISPTKSSEIISLRRIAEQ